MTQPLITDCQWLFHCDLKLDRHLTPKDVQTAADVVLQRYEDYAKDDFRLIICAIRIPETESKASESRNVQSESATSSA
jgi:hypothetical protein